MTGRPPPPTDERLPVALGLSVDGRWLVFEQGGPSKWYAATPTGEYAFGDRSGLYEWFRNPYGQPTRIDYTGGDQVAARNGQRLRKAGHSPPRARGLFRARAAQSEN